MYDFREFGTKTKPPKIELSRVYKSKNAVNDNVEQATSQQDMDEQQNVEETENTPENMDELVSFLYSLMNKAVKCNDLLFIVD